MSLASCLGGLLLALPLHAADTATDEETIRAMVAAFDKAMNAKDAAALARLFHEDGDFTNVIGMTARGPKAIEELHRPLFEGDGTKGLSSFKHAVLKVVDVRVRFVRPDVAGVDVTWTLTGVVREGKELGPRRGLMNWITSKEDGRWGIAVMHNMDLPPAGSPKTP